MHTTLLELLFSLALGVAGFSKECWHCFSEKNGNCKDPYKGRHGPNSTILRPDCSHDMARAFHANVIYVLATKSRIVSIGSNDTGKWRELYLAPNNFDCCKNEMNVVTFDGAQQSVVVRGCCHAPTVYDQCQEVRRLCREITETTRGSNGTINRSTCHVTHCSTCATDSCNTANALAENACNLISLAILLLESLKFDFTE